MKFGTEEFKEKTLFGLATMDAMDQIVAKVGEYIEPTKSQMSRKGYICRDGKHLKEMKFMLILEPVMFSRWKHSFRYIENIDLKKENRIG